MSKPPVLARIKAHVLPAAWLLLAIYYNITTVLSLLFISHDFHSLVNITKVRRRAYSKLWLAWGASYAEQLPGNTEKHLRKARGTVLEIGAGSGELLHLYSPSKIDTIYGVEPAEDLYPRLEERAEAAGFGNCRYIILKCGAEASSLIPALAKVGLLKGGTLEEGIFDTIVCVRVLCMVPDVEEVVGVLYQCLKKGGKLVVCEHGSNHGNIVPKIIQVALMTWKWSFWMGDCHLDRSMESILKNAAKEGGTWKVEELETIDEWAVLPYTVGYFVK